MTIDINKKYKTKAGDDVRILCVDRGGPYPILGLVGNQVRGWRANGHSASGYANRDLVEVVPTVWRTIGHTHSETDAYVRDGHDVLFVGALKCDTLDELRLRLYGYKFAGEFRGETLLRVVAL
jgi:hypothetical protein